MDCRVHFFDDAYAPVELTAGATLSEHLDVGNSPLLFGCRTGICGTCLVRVEGELPPPSEEERELVEMLAPGDPQARLACQLRLVGDVRVGPHPEAG
ncbi:MAG: ferredoxin [Myxococcales bacterium]|nr:ferredoxin [Myxococcales bacterium]